MLRLDRRRVVAVSIAVLVVVAGVVIVTRSSPQDHNPFAGRDLFVWAGSAAAAAADRASGTDAADLEDLADTPTAVWLTPEAHGPDTIGSFVEDVLAGADGRAVVLVVYGITDRDCVGEESQGGLVPGLYTIWVRTIAAALSGTVAVVLEPDALATIEECSNPGERYALLHEAVAAFHDRATVYLDAGHSNWIEPQVMAERLQRSGVEDARGFSVNVANYQTDADELAYAEQIREVVPEAHYVVDSGRNGAGSTDDWCNPPGRTLGVRPAAVDDDSALDARLWIKPPGESDGTCHGGPAAGQFWLERALELADGKRE
ncbi:MAG: glycoside hydrolase family 6 protein [Aeromicrobium sp.]|uniref:glycoside hydrolase family 6 protein n=1 Tax=Aeromicrobium sp. TaxID=1871063 RepID=UPI00260981F7|nr:glycoside hydrolase family 6 protein [Aeromicrobium sp.]MDF1703862.1 glycoside hydrolase family 6 protein [Aeromicrobium sp.]